MRSRFSSTGWGASLACAWGIACGTVPDVTFAPDCQLADACAPEAGAVGDASVTDAADAHAATDAAADAAPDVTQPPPVCPLAIPSGAITCCGGVPCVNTSRKKCSDECETCERDCAGQICCVDAQGEPRCASTIGGCF